MSLVCAPRFHHLKGDGRRMLRTMLKSKIHRATVTRSDLHYVGSITIDSDLIESCWYKP